MRLELPTAPIKPHRLLPVFQQMTNYFVDLSVQAVESTGEKISCKAGCGACCRQPVPISELEIYQIAALVESLPEPRRSEVRKRFSEAREHFENIGWFKQIADCDAAGQTKSIEDVKSQLQMLVDKYFREGVACPFLENESCSIHSARPLVCREYLVTSPPDNCSRENGGEIRRINLFMSPSKTVQHLGVSGKMENMGFVPLIRALELAETFPESFEEKTPELWVDEFFDRLNSKQKTRDTAHPGKKQRHKRKKAHKH